MEDNIRFLVDLQQRDNKISQLRSAIACIPGQIEDLKQKLSATKEDLQNLTEEIAGNEKERRTLELSVEDHKEILAKSKLKLHEVKTNKEYSALLLEIETMEKTIYNTEDEILNKMETMDNKATLVKEKKVIFSREEKLFASLKAEKEQELNSLQQELDIETADRAKLSADLDKGVLVNYERLKHVRNGLAVVTIAGNVCQGCNMTLPPQVVAMAMAGREVTHCEYCDRILFTSS